MGVIVYVLLAGYPPFYDEDQKKLFKKIKEGKYYFHEDYWGHVSQEIRKMLCVNQKERWTARQLLDHPWITKNDDDLKGKDLTKTIVQMKKFNARRRLKAAMDAVIIANRIKNMGFGNKKKAIAIDTTLAAHDDDAVAITEADAIPGFLQETPKAADAPK